MTRKASCGRVARSQGMPRATRRGANRHDESAWRTVLPYAGHFLRLLFKGFAAADGHGERLVLSA